MGLRLLSRVVLTIASLIPGESIRLPLPCMLVPGGFGLVMCVCFASPLADGVLLRTTNTMLDTHLFLSLKLTDISLSVSTPLNNGGCSGFGSW